MYRQRKWRQTGCFHLIQPFNKKNKRSNSIKPLSPFFSCIQDKGTSCETDRSASMVTFFFVLHYVKTYCSNSLTEGFVVLELCPSRVCVCKCEGGQGLSGGHRGDISTHCDDTWHSHTISTQYAHERCAHTLIPTNTAHTARARVTGWNWSQLFACCVSVCYFLPEESHSDRTHYTQHTEVHTHGLWHTGYTPARDNIYE